MEIIQVIIQMVQEKAQIHQVIIQMVRKNSNRRGNNSNGGEEFK